MRVLEAWVGGRDVIEPGFTLIDCEFDTDVTPIVGASVPESKIMNIIRSVFRVRRHTSTPLELSVILQYRITNKL